MDLSCRGMKGAIVMLRIRIFNGICLVYNFSFNPLFYDFLSLYGHFYLAEAVPTYPLYDLKTFPDFS